MAASGSSGIGWPVMAASRAAIALDQPGLDYLGRLYLGSGEVLAPEFLNNLAGYQDNVVPLIALRLILSLYSFVAAIRAGEVI